jgi:hypothetical protein
VVLGTSTALSGQDVLKVAEAFDPVVEQDVRRGAPRWLAIPFLQSTPA